MQTVVLVIASIVVLAGGALIGVRELTASGRRRIGPIRDFIEVAIPIVGLVVLVAAMWVAR